MISNNTNQKCPVLLQTGFRIFFLGAAVYSVVSIVFWMLFYVLGINIFVGMPINVWHGHEMIYGFAMAVVAGFLLTAVTNWTGQKTLNGVPLLVLFLFWMAARVLSFMPASVPGWIMAVCDNVFLVFLIIAVVRPVVKVKQWRQFAVLAKVVLVGVSSIFFYLAISGQAMKEGHMALHFAMYMIISLILTIARRIMPFFVEKGVGYSVTLRNSKILDLASLVLLVLLSVIDVFWTHWRIVPVLSILLAVVHAMRLWGWYTAGIWKKPLLWILFVGYVFLIVGFVLKFLTYVSTVPIGSYLHAFTYGGIGLFTLGMMARVSLGHTGRNVHEAPPMVSVMFFVLIIGACVRVFLPIFDEVRFPLWIAISQIMWMMAFVLFIFQYYTILTSPRADGKFG